MELGDDARASLSNVGVVVIGRNEGERLRRCLSSLAGSVRRVIYVDSGSVDGSVEVALTLGAHVVPLDLTSPFTAARARNAGLARLLDENAALGFVLTIDGDCELREGFLRAALLAMREDDALAVVCGRRRERSPEASPYDRLCDMEWDTPVGLVEACGGDALLRVSALADAGGYDESLIAGEEPELCWRLRQGGWKVRRIEHEMTWHEAGIVRFSQWWRRSVRAGHAYAELYARHRHWAREVVSILVYGLGVPLAALAMLALRPALAAIFAGAVYAALYWRVKQERTKRGDAPRDAALYARFCVIAKFAHLVGMLEYVRNRLLGRRSAIIEYKGEAVARHEGSEKPVTT